MKFKWKTLKAVHMKTRFMENFLQLKKHGSIIDIKKMLPFWEEIKKRFILLGNEGFHDVLIWAEKEAEEKFKQVKKEFPMSRRIRHH